MRLHSVTSGQGPARALLLHPALAHGGIWAGVMAGLRDVLTGIAVDLPGHGRSPDWDKSRDYHSVATDAAIAALDDQPAHLIGHSLGGTIALRIALMRPDLALSLTLIEPVLFAAVRGSRAFDTQTGAAALVTAHLGRGDPMAAAAAFLGAWGAEDWARIPHGDQIKLAQRIHLIPETAGALEDDNAGLLAPGRLESFLKPVLFLRGSNSPAIMAEIEASLASRLSDTRGQVIGGAGHMLTLTHPDATARAIRSFLQPIII